MANGFGMLKILIGTAQADALAGGAGADELYGGPGNDTLTGAGGDDWLQPGSGNDTINGGAGFDALAYDLDDSEPPITRGVVVDLASGTATDSWNGTDTLLGIEDVFGSPRADRITGNAADNVLDGGAGNDTLNGGNGEDWLQPGPGSDSVTGGGGFDFVSYEEDQSTVPVTRGVDADLARGTALDGWGGTDTLIGVERLFGSGRADRLAGDDRGNDLMGAGGNDTLAGAGGEDWLEPGPGNDLLNGGAGDDVASYEDAAGDPAATRGLNADLAKGTAADPWGGTDTLVAIENLVGTPRADTLAGAGENTLLDGRAGNDRLLRGDIVYEEAPAGIFVNLGTTARSRDGTTVAARTAHDGYGGIDTLGAGVVSGYGSRFADVWFGGSGNAYVILRAGNDFLRSGPGDDWLQGGSGADTIDGGGGFDGISYEDDGYDSAGLAFRGVRVNLATGAATDGWNNADQLSGIEDVFGSTLADLITGDAEWNYIDGGAGNDTLNGGGGNDYFLGGAGDDAVNGGAGQDFFAVGGASLADYRIVHNDDGSTTVTDLNPADGDDGVDRLVSVEQLGLAVLGTPDDDILLSEGVDPILAIGSNGNDRYVLKFAADQVVERAGQGTDSVEAGISRVLEPNVENLVLTGEASIDGTGNSAANALTGNAGDNVLNGAAGADTLRGGAGSDTYYVDSTGDEVIEVAPAQLAADRDSEATGGNIDTVISQVSYTLRANVENLQLAGLAALNGTGNGLDNLMQGNGGANRLGGLAGLDIIDGGGGNDTLSGGGGNDTLGGGAGADVFQFDTAPAGGNTDTVTDFQTGVDRILLDDDAYTAFNAAQSGQLAPAQFHSAAGAQAAHDADDRIVYNLSTGALYYDADGQGGGGAIRFATLAGQPALAAADFLIGS